MKCSIKERRGKWYVVTRTVQALLVLSLFTVFVPRLYACPNCKDALTEGMARGFYWSILWMLSVPAAIVSVMAFVVWRARRRQRAQDLPHEQSS